MNCEQCLHREEGVQVLLPITRPPEHSAVAGLLPELPVAGVIFDIFVLEVHVEVFDAAFSVRDLKVQEDQVGNLTPDFGGIRRFLVVVQLISVLVCLRIRCTTTKKYLSAF